MSPVPLSRGKRSFITHPDTSRCKGLYYNIVMLDECSFYYVKDLYRLISIIMRDDEYFIIFDGYVYNASLVLGLSEVSKISPCDYQLAVCTFENKWAKTYSMS